MKKYLRMWVLLFALPLLTQTFVSCGDEDDEPNLSQNANTNNGNGNAAGGATGGNDDDGDGGSAMTPLTSSQQKVRLEKAGIALMDEVPSSTFKDLVDFTEGVAEIYEDYEWNNVEDWADNIFDELLTTTYTDEEYDEELWYYSKYIYNTFYTDYTGLIMASNFKGHFTARNGQWVYSDADDLQFIFKDQRGQQCVLKLAISGTTKKLYLGELDKSSYDWYYRGTENGVSVYVSNSYYNSYDLTVGVPEKIVVTLTRGTEIMMTQTTNFSLTGIEGESDFNIAKSGLTASSVLELNNGFKFSCDKLSYVGNGKAQMACGVSKNGKSLVSMNISTDISGMPSWYVSDLENIDDELENVNGKNAYVSIDLIGQVQFVGQLLDVRAYANYLDWADKNEYSESAFKSYINQANDLMNIGVYYDKASTKQASMKLECFEDYTWGGYCFWEKEPVIVFSDGSSYSTFETFFEYGFDDLIDTFEDLLDDWENI